MSLRSGPFSRERLAAGRFLAGADLRAPRHDGVGPSSGSFGWDGGFHTSCYVDPQEDMIAILLAQRLMTSPRPSDFYTDFWTLAYQAIDD